MDITSYLLGKNASGGGGGSSTIYPYSISFRNNKSETIDLSGVDFANYGVSNINDIFRECNNVEELHFNNFTKTLSSATNTFNNCYKLKTANFDTIDLGGASAINNMQNMFANCNSLTDDSLNRILLMCTSATGITGTKALRSLNVPQALRTRITNNPENYSNYQAFINAGWTIE